MDVELQEVTEPWNGELRRPSGEGSTPETGILVLSGSSGEIEGERADLFAAQGMSTLSIRWCGGPGQPEGPTEVPLETFTAAVDLLQAQGAQRIGVLGWSKGAEAALLTAVHDSRVDVVVALAPTAYVWCWGDIGGNRPPRSSWTWRGQPLPFVPMDGTWLSEHWPPQGLLDMRDWYEHSERLYPEHAETAAIPVEKARAELVLVAGGDDRMWPSVPFAEKIAKRRQTPGAAGGGRPVRLVSRPDAGHQPRFPGEPPARPSGFFAYGGTQEADARLGAEAWPVILHALRGSEDAGP